MTNTSDLPLAVCSAYLLYNIVPRSGVASPVGSCCLRYSYSSCGGSCWRGGGIGGVTGDPSERLVGGSTAERLCVMGRMGGQQQDGVNWRWMDVYE